MKRNFKKLFAVLTMLVCVFAITACGAKEESTVSFDEAYLQSVGDWIITNCTNMTAEQMETYTVMEDEELEELVSTNSLPFTGEALRSIFSGYMSSMTELGTYVSADGYDELVIDGDEATLTGNYTFENHPMKMSIVFNKKSVAQSISIDPVYSTGEIIEKAALNTVLGMGTVFAVLIFISMIISLMGYIPKIQENFTKKNAAQNMTEEKVLTAPVLPAVAEEVDDLEIIAVITAAVAATLGTSTEGFTVRSIKRSKTNKWQKA